MQSSIIFRHAVRESAVEIEKICGSAIPGHVISVDSYAIREWSVKRETKSHHFPSSTGKRKSLLLHYMRKLECYIHITVPKNRHSDEGTENHRSIIQLWSLSLNLIQEIYIESCWPVCCAISPDDRLLIIVDTACRVVIIKITELKKKKKQVTQNKFEKSTASDGNRNTTYRNSSAVTNNATTSAGGQQLLTTSMNNKTFQIEEMQTIQIYGDVSGGGNRSVSVDEVDMAGSEEEEEAVHADGKLKFAQSLVGVDFVDNFQFVVYFADRVFVYGCEPSPLFQLQQQSSSVFSHELGGHEHSSIDFASTTSGVALGDSSAGMRSQSRGEFMGSRGGSALIKSRTIGSGTDVMNSTRKPPLSSTRSKVDAPGTLSSRQSAMLSAKSGSTRTLLKSEVSSASVNSGSFYGGGGSSSSSSSSYDETEGDEAFTQAPRAGELAFDDNIMDNEPFYWSDFDLLSVLDVGYLTANARRSGDAPVRITCVKKWSSDTPSMFVGFDNGVVRLFAYDVSLFANGGDAAASKHPHTPPIELLSFIAHFDGQAVREIVLYNNINKLNPSSTIYNVELLTSGDDGRLCHWGFQERQLHPDAYNSRNRAASTRGGSPGTQTRGKALKVRLSSSNSESNSLSSLLTSSVWMVDLLGEQSLPAEYMYVEVSIPQWERVAAHKKTKTVKVPVCTSMRNINIFTGLASDTSVANYFQLCICSFGGQLVIMELTQPVQLIMKRDNNNTDQQLCLANRNGDDGSRSNTHFRGSTNSVIDKMGVTSRKLKIPSNISENMSWKTLIKFATFGPTSMIQQDQVDGDDVLSIQQTLFLLQDDNSIAMVSAESGEMLKNISLHLNSNAIDEHDMSPMKMKQRVVDMKRNHYHIEHKSKKDISDLAEEVFPESSTASCVHWCDYSRNIIIGYSNGTIAFVYFTMPNPNGGLNGASSTIRSNGIGNPTFPMNAPKCRIAHKHSITFISSYQLQEVEYSNDDKFEEKLDPNPIIYKRVYVIVGDSVGAISIWLFSAFSPNDTFSTNTTAPPQLLFKNNMHQGSILSLHTFSLPWMQILQSYLSTAAQGTTNTDDFVYPRDKVLPTPSALSFEAFKARKLKEHHDFFVKQNHQKYEMQEEGRDDGGFGMEVIDEQNDGTKKGKKTAEVVYVQPKRRLRADPAAVFMMSSCRSGLICCWNVSVEGRMELMSSFSSNYSALPYNQPNLSASVSAMTSLCSTALWPFVVHCKQLGEVEENPYKPTAEDEEFDDVSAYLYENSRKVPLFQDEAIDEIKASVLFSSSSKYILNNCDIKYPKNPWDPSNNDDDDEENSLSASNLDVEGSQKVIQEEDPVVTTLHTLCLCGYENGEIRSYLVVNNHSNNDSDTSYSHPPLINPAKCTELMSTSKISGIKMFMADTNSNFSKPKRRKADDNVHDFSSQYARTVDNCAELTAFYCDSGMENFTDNIHCLAAVSSTNGTLWLIRVYGSGFIECLHRYNVNFCPRSVLVGKDQMQHHRSKDNSAANNSSGTGGGNGYLYVCMGMLLRELLASTNKIGSLDEEDDFNDMLNLDGEESTEKREVYVSRTMEALCVHPANVSKVLLTVNQHKVHKLPQLWRNAPAPASENILDTTGMTYPEMNEPLTPNAVNPGDPNLALPMRSTTSKDVQVFFPDDEKNHKDAEKVSRSSSVPTVAEGEGGEEHIEQQGSDVMLQRSTSGAFSGAMLSHSNSSNSMDGGLTSAKMGTRINVNMASHLVSLGSATPGTGSGGTAGGQSPIPYASRDTEDFMQHRQISNENPDGRDEVRDWNSSQQPTEDVEGNQYFAQPPTDYSPTQSQTTAALAAAHHSSTHRETMMVELHLTKKDVNLLEKFTQHEATSAGSISLDGAVDLVYNWLIKSRAERTGTPSNLISVDMIWSLVELLQIEKTERLTFLDVAKVAAIVSSAVGHTIASTGGNSGKGVKRRNPKSYKNMKTTMTKVYYNSMGERIVEKVPVMRSISDGLPSGFCSDMKKIWAEQEARIITLDDVRAAEPIPSNTILQEVPKCFKGLLNKSVVHIPSVWRSSAVTRVNHDRTYAIENGGYIPTGDDFWLSLRRAIRIARTIVNMRSTWQRTFMASVSSTDVLSFAKFVSESKKATNREFPPDVPLAKIVVSYFERHFGSSKLHVAHQKVQCFVEACMQYIEYPLMHFLAVALELFSFQNAEAAASGLLDTSTGGDESDQSSLLNNYDQEQKQRERVDKEACLWLYIEMRDLVFSRNMVLLGDKVPSTDEEFNLGGGYGSESGGSDEENSLYSEKKSRSGKPATPGIVKMDGCSKNEVHWLLIQRSDAIVCTDEMLRLRGRFGSQFIDAIVKKVYTLPAVSGEHRSIRRRIGAGAGGAITTIINRDMGSELIDCEAFLEMISLEFLANQKKAEELYNEVYFRFIKTHTSVVKTKAHDINPPGSEKGLIEDDICSTDYNLVSASSTLAKMDATIIGTGNKPADEAKTPTKALINDKVSSYSTQSSSTSSVGSATDSLMNGDEDSPVDSSGRAAPLPFLSQQQASNGPTDTKPLVVPSIHKQASIASLPQEFKRENLQISMSRIDGLFKSFIVHDGGRTGCIEASKFENVLHCQGQYYMGYASELDIKALVKLCAQHYRVLTDGTICYLDMWAILLAWLMDSYGKDIFNASVTINAIKTISKGLEEDHAFALVSYMGFIQCMTTSDTFWMCKDVTHRTLVRFNELAMLNAYEGATLASPVNVGNKERGGTAKLGHHHGLTTSTGSALPTNGAWEIPLLAPYFPKPSSAGHISHVHQPHVDDLVDELLDEDKPRRQGASNRAAKIEEDAISNLKATKTIIKLNKVETHDVEMAIAQAAKAKTKEHAGGTVGSIAYGLLNVSNAKIGESGVSNVYGAAERSLPVDGAAWRGEVTNAAAIGALADGKHTFTNSGVKEDPYVPTVHEVDRPIATLFGESGKPLTRTHNTTKAFGKGGKGEDSITLYLKNQGPSQEDDRPPLKVVDILGSTNIERPENYNSKYYSELGVSRRGVVSANMFGSNAPLRNQLTAGPKKAMYHSQSTPAMTSHQQPLDGTADMYHPPSPAYETDNTIQRDQSISGSPTPLTQNSRSTHSKMNTSHIPFSDNLNSRPTTVAGTFEQVKGSPDVIHQKRSMSMGNSVTDVHKALENVRENSASAEELPSCYQDIEFNMNKYADVDKTATTTDGDNELNTSSVSTNGQDVPSLSNYNIHRGESEDNNISVTVKHTGGKNITPKLQQQVDSDSLTVGSKGISVGGSTDSGDNSELLHINKLSRGGSSSSSLGSQNEKSIKALSVDDMDSRKEESHHEYNKSSHQHHQTLPQDETFFSPKNASASQLGKYFYGSKTVAPGHHSSTISSAANQDNGGGEMIHQIQRSAALIEAERRRLDIQRHEHEMKQKVLGEAQLLLDRRKAKLLQLAKERKELQMKERESMLKMQEANEERHQRNQRYLDMEENIRKAEEADKVSKEMEEQRRQTADRMKRNAARAAKEEQEALQEAERKERELEKAECLLMREEEKYGEILNGMIMEDIKAREEDFQRLAKLAEDEEEERHLMDKEEVRTRAIMLQEWEWKRRREEWKEMKFNDINIRPDPVTPPAEEDEEKTANSNTDSESENESEYGSLTYKHSTNPADGTRTQQTLNTFLKKLSSADGGNDKHPRKMMSSLNAALNSTNRMGGNPDNSTYFMPLEFGPDIRYQPFENRTTLMLHPYKENYDPPAPVVPDVGSAPGTAHTNTNPSGSKPGSRGSAIHRVNSSRKSIRKSISYTRSDMDGGTPETVLHSRRTATANSNISDIHMLKSEDSFGHGFPSFLSSSHDSGDSKPHHPLAYIYKNVENENTKTLPILDDNEDDELLLGSSTTGFAAPTNHHVNSSTKVRDFSYITGSIATYKKNLVKERNSQLYQTSNNDVPPNEWTSLILVSSIHWGDYFAKDRQTRLEAELLAETPEQKRKRQEAIFLKELQNQSEVDVEIEDEGTDDGDEDSASGSDEEKSLSSSSYHETFNNNDMIKSKTITMESGMGGSEVKKKRKSGGGSGLHGSGSHENGGNHHHHHHHHHHHNEHSLLSLLPSSLMEDLKQLIILNNNSNGGIRPLPFGVVEKAVIKVHSYNYYQVEVFNNEEALVTLELKCLYGEADMYVKVLETDVEADVRTNSANGSYSHLKDIVGESPIADASGSGEISSSGDNNNTNHSHVDPTMREVMKHMPSSPSKAALKLPSCTSSEYSGSSTSSESKTVRLVIKPSNQYINNRENNFDGSSPHHHHHHHSQGSSSKSLLSNRKKTTMRTILIAVHSPVTGAMYSLWSFASSEPNPQESMARVGKTVRAFEILTTNYTSEELWKNLPKAIHTAKTLAQEEYDEIHAKRMKNNIFGIIASKDPKLRNKPGIRGKYQAIEEVGDESVSNSSKGTSTVGGKDSTSSHNGGNISSNTAASSIALQQSVSLEVSESIDNEDDEEVEVNANKLAKLGGTLDIKVLDTMKNMFTGKTVPETPRIRNEDDSSDEEDDAQWDSNILGEDGKLAVTKPKAGRGIIGTGGECDLGADDIFTLESNVAKAGRHIMKEGLVEEVRRAASELGMSPKERKAVIKSATLHHDDNDDDSLFSALSSKKKKHESKSVVVPINTNHTMMMVNERTVDPNNHADLYLNIDLPTYKQLHDEIMPIQTVEAVAKKQKHILEKAAANTAQMFNQSYKDLGVSTDMYDGSGIDRSASGVGGASGYNGKTTHHGFSGSNDPNHPFYSSASASSIPALPQLVIPSQQQEQQNRMSASSRRGLSGVESKSSSSGKNQMYNSTSTPSLAGSYNLLNDPVMMAANNLSKRTKQIVNKKAKSRHIASHKSTPTLAPVSYSLRNMQAAEIPGPGGGKNKSKPTLSVSYL